MNLNLVIRPWVLSILTQYGIRYAAHVRWPDASTRQHEMYAEYMVVSMVPEQDGLQDQTTVDDSDVVTHSAWQVWLTTVEVVIYNSQDGASELAGLAISAQHNQSIKDLFDRHSAAFHRVVRIDDISEPYDDKTIYKHRLVCEFRTNEEYSLEDTNAVVDEIIFQIEPDDFEYTVSDSGWTAGNPS